jgi:hypothetical protein
LIHLEQKNVRCLVEELLNFFSFEILASSNWHAFDYDIWYQTTFFIPEKCDFFLGSFSISHYQKFISQWTGKNLPQRKQQIVNF